MRPAAPVVDKKARKQVERAEKQAKKDAEKQAQADQIAADRECAGRCLARETFGGRAIEIYQNGYVRIGMLVRESTPFQKLLGVTTSADITKKSGFGRGAAAVMTGGANLLSSNKRGDVYLTIVTEERTYSLTAAPSMGAPRAAQAVAAAAQVALGGAQ